MLRGPESVRADHRLCTDETAIRAQSAMLNNAPALSLLFSITVFSGRMLIIRTESTVGARSAQ